MAKDEITITTGDAHVTCAAANAWAAELRRRANQKRTQAGKRNADSTIRTVLKDAAEHIDSTADSIDRAAARISEKIKPGVHTTESGEIFTTPIPDAPEIKAKEL